MSQIFTFLSATLAAALLLSACGSSSSNYGSAASASQPATSQQTSSGSSVRVRTAANKTLGATVLVNSRGMTLYHLSAEQNGKFICTSPQCVKTWRPLTINSGSSPSGTGSLGTLTRPDGSGQVTYKGMPLYTFAQDMAAGQVNGQGVKDAGTWSAVTTSARTTTAPPVAPAPSGSSGGGGY